MEEYTDSLLSAVLPSLLNKFRIYLTLLRFLDYSISDDITKVRARRRDRGPCCPRRCAELGPRGSRAAAWPGRSPCVVRLSGPVPACRCPSAGAGETRFCFVHLPCHPPDGPLRGLAAPRGPLLPAPGTRAVLEGQIGRGRFRPVVAYLGRSWFLGV